MHLGAVPLEGGGALAGLLNAALEGNGHRPQLGHLLSAVGLLGVKFSQSTFGQTDEVDVLGDGLAADDLAGWAAFRDAVAGEADLAGQLLDDMLREGALAGLGLQRLGDLGWDFLVLNALFPLAFELVLNLPGQVGLALSAGLDAIAGDLEFGVAVNALAGTGQPFAVFLVEASAKTAEFALERLAAEDLDVDAVVRRRREP